MTFLSQNRKHTMTLDDALEGVKDGTTLLEFVRLLQADREDEVARETTSASSPFGPGINGWENQTIESFLQASTAWAEATDFGISQGLSKDNPWRQFAVFLYCGKIYE
jgi:hypothetical protein